MNKIRIGIAGYGNLGKGVELAVAHNQDMELVAVFTRRDPSTLAVQNGVPVVSIEQAADWQDKIDVLIICGGSATDLPKQVLPLANISTLSTALIRTPTFPLILPIWTLH